MTTFTKPTYEQLTYQGMYRTSALILETQEDQQKKIDAIYTLRDDNYVWKGKTFFSLRKLFLALDDLTGTKLANECFASYAQLESICQNTKVSGKWNEWHKELEAMQLARALETIIVQSEEGDVQSSKFLVKEAPKAIKELLKGMSMGGVDAECLSLDKQHKDAVDKRIKDEYLEDFNHLYSVK